MVVTDGISDVHDVIHLCQRRVADANSKGEIRYTGLRSAYVEIGAVERLRVRLVIDETINQCVREMDWRAAKAWVACLDALTAVMEGEKL